MRHDQNNSAFFRRKAGYTKGGLISSREKYKQANYTKISRFFDWNANFASKICRIGKKFGFKSSIRAFFSGKTGYTKGGLISSRKKKQTSKLHKNVAIFSIGMPTLLQKYAESVKNSGSKAHLARFFSGKTRHTKGGLISSRKKINKQTTQKCRDFSIGMPTLLQKYAESAKNSASKAH